MSIEFHTNATESDRKFVLPSLTGDTKMLVERLAKKDILTAGKSVFGILFSEPDSFSIEFSVIFQYGNFAIYLFETDDELYAYCPGQFIKKIGNPAFKKNIKFGLQDNEGSATSPAWEYFTDYIVEHMDLVIRHDITNGDTVGAENEDSNLNRFFKDYREGEMIDDTSAAFLYRVFKAIPENYLVELIFLSEGVDKIALGIFCNEDGNYFACDGVTSCYLFNAND